MNNALCILLVDDNTIMTRTIADILDVEGYVVLTANSGEEALRIIHTGSVDILLTDVHMPGMNGVELAREAVKINPLMVIIFVTAYSNDEILKQARADGITNILDKPLNMPLLLSMLQGTRSQATET